jgi:hypothetical protein
MAAVPGSEVLQDNLAVSLARVVAVANKRASELGVDIPQSIIITPAEKAERDEYDRIEHLVVMLKTRETEGKQQ